MTNKQVWHYSTKRDICSYRIVAMLPQWAAEAILDDAARRDVPVSKYVRDILVVVAKRILETRGSDGNEA